MYYIMNIGSLQSHQRKLYKRKIHIRKVKVQKNLFQFFYGIIKYWQKTFYMKKQRY